MCRWRRGCRGEEGSGGEGGGGQRRGEEGEGGGGCRGGFRQNEPFDKTEESNPGGGNRNPGKENRILDGFPGKLSMDQVVENQIKGRSSLTPC